MIQIDSMFLVKYPFSDSFRRDSIQYFRLITDNEISFLLCN